MTDLDRAVNQAELKRAAQYATQKAIEHAEELLAFLQHQLVNDRDAVQGAQEEVEQLHRAIVEQVRADKAAERAL
jgi:hypothetical protein